MSTRYSGSREAEPFNDEGVRGGVKQKVIRYIPLGRLINFTVMPRTRNNVDKFITSYILGQVRLENTCAIGVSKIRLDIPDRSDCQRELKTLIFLPDDHRNQNPRPGSSDVPAFRYGETEFSDEGHEERLDLCDALLVE